VFVLTLGLLWFILPTMAQAQFNYTINNGAVTITGYSGPGGAVVIPGWINSLPVTGIDQFAICYNSSVTSLTFPDSLTNIADFACIDCYSLNRITFGKGLINIGLCAFADGFVLDTVTFPRSLKNIGNSAFFHCDRLAGIYFEGNAPTVGAQVFTADYPGAAAYYLPGTTNWGPYLGELPAVLWNPQIQRDASFGVKNNRFGFNILATNLLAVVVAGCTNLANPHWILLQTNIIYFGHSYFSDPDPANYPRRYYRLCGATGPEASLPP
jgi:hypothetical protein